MTRQPVGPLLLLPMSVAMQVAADYLTTSARPANPRFLRRGPRIHVAPQEKAVIRGLGGKVLFSLAVP